MGKIQTLKDLIEGFPVSSTSHRLHIRAEFDRYFCLANRCPQKYRLYPKPSLSKNYKYVSFIPAYDLNGYPVKSLIDGQIKPAWVRFLFEQMRKSKLSLSVASEDVVLYENFVTREIAHGQAYLKKLEENLAEMQRLMRLGRRLDALMLVPPKIEGKYLTPEQIVKIKIGKQIW